MPRTVPPQLARKHLGRKHLKSRFHHGSKATGTLKAPRDIDSFRDFLLKHARVRQPGGFYTPYTFDGREPLEAVVAKIDEILGSGGGQPLPDASLALCGGAQFGKTVLMLNLLAYLVGVRFRNLGYYLPDDDLVEGIVDGKLRPDVLDQIPWLARRIAVGRTINASGRAVNRKGAFMCTDDATGRTALAYLRGMGKVPTTFTMDVIVQDEKDDIRDDRARFLPGRMTSSDLRFSLVIGTQRVHGAGQNAAFEDGTQHVALLPTESALATAAPPAEGEGWWNPEDHWPRVCRLAVTGAPRRDDPVLTHDGDFVSIKHIDNETGDTRHIYTPGAPVYLACPRTGEPLVRRASRWHARRPERATHRRWSYRISQLAMDALGLGQIVAAWQEAVRDPRQMTAFCCDRLAKPRSTAQQLDPALLARARAVSPFALAPSAAEVPPSAPGVRRLAGLDTGDRCWLVVRDAESPTATRIVWLERLAADTARTRVPELCRLLAIDALLVDAGPLRDLARDLCLTLNGLRETTLPAAFDDAARIELVTTAGAPLVWDGPARRWHGLRAAAVEFTQRDGAGLRHKLGLTHDGRPYPILAANREEVIQQAVNELLTPAEGIIEVRDGRARTQPRLRLPEAGPDIVATFDAHLLAGSRQETSGDGRTRRYVGQCENHFLLADAYAALAEQALAIAPPEPPRHVPAFHPLPHSRPSRTLAG